MKLKLDSVLDYQLKAIKSVTDLFSHDYHIWQEIVFSIL